MELIMKNKIILVQPIYNLIFALFGVSISIVFLFFPKIGAWELSDIYTILWFLLISFILLSMLYLTLNSIQFAIISDSGIKIYILFFLIANLKWDNITDIREEKILQDPRYGGTYYNWLVIRTDCKQQPKRRGRNSKNKPPWHIIATKRNREIIYKFYK